MMVIVLGAAVVGLTGAMPTALGDDYKEVILFDSWVEDALTLAEGLARQRLGLLNEDGKPKVDENGKLVPMVSEKGKAFDMEGGLGTGIKDALEELRDDKGTITIITHGIVGLIEINGEYVPGFGTGTGARGCGKSPEQLDGIGAKTNVTINLVVCEAGATRQDITKVSDSLEREIEDQGGSARATASDKVLKVKVKKDYRAAEGVELTKDEKKKVKEVCLRDIITEEKFEDQYSTLQEALDEAIGKGKVVAKLRYCANIGDKVIENMFPGECGSGRNVEEQSTCASCARVSPVDPFTGDAREDFDCRVVFTPCVVPPCATIFGSPDNNLCTPGNSGCHTTSGWQFRCTIYPKSTSMFFGSGYGYARYTFDLPVTKFGGYFGTNAADPGQDNDPDIIFYDVNMNEIGRTIAEVGNPGPFCDWYWNGWESTGAPIAAVDVIGQLFGGAFIHMDEMRISYGDEDTCYYTLKRSKSKKGCQNCPPKGSYYNSGIPCPPNCAKKFKETIACPSGPGKCKLKGKKPVCR